MNSIFDLYSNTDKSHISNLLLKNKNSKSHESITSSSNSVLSHNPIYESDITYNINNEENMKERTIIDIILENDNLYLLNYLKMFNYKLEDYIIQIIEKNNMQLLKLIKFADINYSITNSFNENLFVIAAKSNNLVALKKMVLTLETLFNNNREDISVYLNSKCSKCNPLIYYFIIKNNMNAIKFLLNYNIELDDFIYNGYTLIQVAIINMEHKLVCELLQYQPNILKTRNKANNKSSLQIIIENNNILYFRIYMKLFNIRLFDLIANDGCKLLSIALTNNNTLMIVELIQLHAIIKIQRAYRKFRLKNYKTI